MDPVLDVCGKDITWNLLRCDECGAILRLRECEYCGMAPSHCGLLIGMDFDENKMWDYYSPEYGLRHNDYVKIFGRYYYIYHLMDWVKINNKITEENMPFSFKDCSTCIGKELK